MNFGPHDPVGDAEDRIRLCRMKHGDRIATYVIDFDQLAFLTRWGDSALRHQFYEGLPRRIKDDMVHHAYVNTLHGIKSVARLIDARYWKREGEKEREREHDKGSGGGSGGGSGPGPTSGNTGRSGKTSGGKKGSSNKNSSTAATSRSKGSGKQPDNQASGKAAEASNKPKRKPYADKLDSRGKLKPEERERRKKLGLCMFCGGSGHSAEDCKKRPQDAQGKAASADSSSGQASTSQGDKSSESKK